MRIMQSAGSIEHFDPKTNQGSGMIRSRHGHAADNHIVVARGFDFL